MELNNIIFPSPKPSYSSQSKNLIWITGEEPKIKQDKTFVRKFNQYKVRAKIIQRNEDKENIQVHNEQKKLKSPIPCLWLPYKEGCNKVILYFHGNAEDLGFSYEFTDQLRKNLQINVMSVEYPGYGAYEGTPTSQQILDDSEIVFDFLTDCLGIHPNDIYLFGRSIGSGPATHLACKKKPGALMLMCPYTSIRDVVKHLAGRLAQYLVADRFRNIDKIEKVKCPTFFVHGQLDKLIPYQHSIDLMSKCQGMTYLSLSEKMTHNDFHMQLDIIMPLKTFFKKCEINIQRGEQKKVQIDTSLFRQPQDYEDLNKEKTDLNNNTKL